MNKDLISRSELLDKLDSIYDCCDMIFEPVDRCCHPDDCRGCKWVQTRNYIRKLVTQIRPAKQSKTRRTKIMVTDAKLETAVLSQQGLNLGDSVYVVCKLFTGEDRYKIYVSRKEINRMEREEDGTIVYTAGKHNELRFCQSKSGAYWTLSTKKKQVFLSKERAEAERKAFTAMEAAKAAEEDMHMEANDDAAANRPMVSGFVQFDLPEGDEE